MENKICCVYKISNVITGRMYVGGTNHYSLRKRQHLHELRSRCHYSKSMQDEFNRYGERQFVFSILELSSLDKLRETEQKWLDKLHPEFNTNRDAITPNPEIVQSSKVRKSISEAIKEKWNDPKYRGKCIDGFKSRPSNRKGSKLSDETKDKIRQANLGENNPHYGKPRPQSTRDKISKSNYKTYAGAISPDGIVYAPIVGMREFCKQHDLCESSMIALMRHRLDKHKGWVRYEV
jgi:group I intron endonuclease